MAGDIGPQHCKTQANEQRTSLTKATLLHLNGLKVIATEACVVGSCSQANYLLRNSAMDDSIGGS